MDKEANLELGDSEKPVVIGDGTNNDGNLGRRRLHVATKIDRHTISPLWRSDIVGEREAQRGRERTRERERDTNIQRDTERHAKREKREKRTRNQGKSLPSKPGEGEGSALAASHEEPTEDDMGEGGTRTACKEAI